MKKIQLRNFLLSFRLLTFCLLISSPLALAMEMQSEKQENNKLENNESEKTGLAKDILSKVSTLKSLKSEYQSDEVLTGEFSDHLPNNFPGVAFSKDGEMYIVRCTPTLTNSNHYLHPKA